MEIHYIKLGGWINTSILHVHGSGSVEAYHIRHASWEVLDSASTFLSEKEQRKIASLFGSFSSYDSYYHPDDWWTDQNLHTTILIYDGEPDTVAVYQLERANIPSGLAKIIDEMETIWESMFDSPNDSIVSCQDSPNNSTDYRSWAHGFWEVVGGDTHILGGIGLIVYDWYAVDTNTGSDSVNVTWDDGLACTTTPGTMDGNRISTEVRGVKAFLEVHSECDATATFQTEEETYSKTLEKKTNDPTVFCF